MLHNLPTVHICYLLLRNILTTLRGDFLWGNFRSEKSFRGKFLGKILHGGGGFPGMI